MYIVFNTIYIYISPTLSHHEIDPYDATCYCMLSRHIIKTHINGFWAIAKRFGSIWEVWAMRSFPGRLAIPQQTTLCTILGSGMYLQSFLRNAWQPEWPLDNPRQWHADDCRSHVCWVIHHNCLQSPPHGTDHTLFCTTVLCLILHKHLLISYQTMSCSTTSYKLHWQHCATP